MQEMYQFLTENAKKAINTNENHNFKRNTIKKHV